MKKIFGLLIILLLGAGCNDRGCYFPPTAQYLGEKTVSVSEQVYMVAELVGFGYRAEGNGAVFFYGMRDGRMVSLEGKSDFDISYTQADDGSISVFRDGELYLQGVFNEDESELSVIFTGSVQPVWDEYARELGWGNELVLKRH